MKNKKSVFHSYEFISVIAIIVISIIFIIRDSSTFEYNIDDKPVLINNLDTCYSNESDFLQISQECFQNEKKKGKYIWYKIQKKNINGHLLLKNTRSPIDVFEDGKHIYKYPFGKNVVLRKFKKHNHIIRLSENKNSVVYIRKINANKNKPLLLYTGSIISLFLSLLWRELFYISCTLFFIFSFGFQLLILVRKDLEHDYFYYFFIVFSSAILTFGMTESALLVYNNVAFWAYVRIVCLYLLPAGILKFFETSVLEEKKIIINIMYYAQITFTFASLFLESYDFAHVLIGPTVFGLLFLINTIVLFYYSFIYIKKGSSEAKIFAIAFGIQMIGGILDPLVMNNMVPGIETPIFGPLGVVVFVVLLQFILRMRIINMNKELADLNVQLHETNESLISANLSLEALDKTKSDFLSLISHEMITPLNGISSAANFLETNVNDEDDVELVKILKKSVNRLERFSHAALMITTLKTDKNVMQLSKRLVSEIVEEAIQNVKKRIERNSLKIFTQIFPPDLVINIDSELISETLANIIENSLLHNSGDTTVFVKVTQLEQTVRFEISDNGSGFDEETLSDIKQLFTKNDIEHHTEGLGLNLYLAQLVLAAHGGSISLLNNEHGGALVVFTIPIHYCKCKILT